MTFSHFGKKGLKHGNSVINLHMKRYIDQSRRKLTQHVSRVLSMWNISSYFHTSGEIRRLRSRTKASVASRMNFLVGAVCIFVFSLVFSKTWSSFGQFASIFGFPFLTFTVVGASYRCFKQLWERVSGIIFAKCMLWDASCYIRRHCEDSKPFHLQGEKKDVCVCVCVCVCAVSYTHLTLPTTAEV